MLAPAVPAQVYSIRYPARRLEQIVDEASGVGDEET